MKALEYLEQFQQIPRADLKVKYPAATDESVDFIEKVLVFNPYYRISLEDALAHPLFEPVRQIEKEAIHGQSVSLDFEKLDLNKATLRQLILEECQYY